MSEQHPEGLTEKLTGAYNRMLERTREAMDKAGKQVPCAAMAQAGHRRCRSCAVGQL